MWFTDYDQDDLDSLEEFTVGGGISGDGSSGGSVGVGGAIITAVDGQLKLQQPLDLRQNVDWLGGLTALAYDAATVDIRPIVGVVYVTSVKMVTLFKTLFRISGCD